MGKTRLRYGIDSRSHLVTYLTSAQMQQPCEVDVRTPATEYLAGAALSGGGGSRPTSLDPGHLWESYRSNEFFTSGGEVGVGV